MLKGYAIVQGMSKKWELNERSRIGPALDQGGVYEENGRHRKENKELKYPLSKKTAGNYEDILNALLWNNIYLSIENTKNDNLREAKRKSLRENLQGVRIQQM